MSISVAPKYVTLEDFKVYTGIDLDEELNGNMNPNLFLRDAENELLNYANMQSWRPINEWIARYKLTAEQMDALREAILIQAKYMFENGDILSNNGIDPEQGVKFGKFEREEAAIAPNAINKLKMAGIVSLVMKKIW